MTYPRMNKEEYGPLPDTIETEEDFDLISEYLVFSAMKIEEIQKKIKNPFSPVLEKRKNEQVLARSWERFDKLCAMMDDYQERQRRRSNGKM